MDTLSRWHPWSDKPGQRHLLTVHRVHSIWKDETAHFDPASAEQAIEFASREKLYVFCEDIMDQREFLYSDDLLLDPRSDTYVQKSGKVVAVRVRAGRNTGFFIPARSWGFPSPNFEMIQTIDAIFRLFKFEAITPASLSEKVARSTMPEKIKIFRPASHLREVLLGSGGGTIYGPDEAQFYKKAYKYDRHKAYLSFVENVPDPFFPPRWHIRPKESWIYDHPTPGYWQVTMVAHGSGYHPIFLEEGGKRRFPREGEQFTKWLWRDEILACEQKGYTLLFIHRGYRWPKTSDFLKPWADLMWSKFQEAQSEEEERIIKSMIVGFFGRCLREPVNHFLVPLGQQQKGDIAIPHNWLHHADNWQKEIKDRKFFTNWYLRAEYNEESTALTPIGASVIKDCRLEMFRLASIEEAKGNKLISTYIDSATFKYPVSSVSMGPLPGQYSEEKLENVWAIRNSLIPDNIEEMRAPGVEGKEERSKLWNNYHYYQENPNSNGF